MDPLLSPAHVLISSAYQVLGNEVQAGMHRQEALRLQPATVVKPKALWLAKIPLLKNLVPSAVRLPQPFLLSEHQRANRNAH